MAIPKEEVIDLLDELITFLDNYVDVNDGDDGQPQANDAMRLQQKVMDLQSELESL